MGVCAFFGRPGPFLQRLDAAVLSMRDMPGAAAMSSAAAVSDAAARRRCYPSCGSAMLSMACVYGGVPGMVVLIPLSRACVIL